MVKEKDGMIQSEPEEGEERRRGDLDGSPGSPLPTPREGTARSPASDHSCAEQKTP